MSSTFADLGVPTDLVAVLDQRGITDPFPIQRAAIPDGIAGHDICGRAPTGSGKTLAFALALVARLPEERGAPKTPEALVLVPTRELCAQVAEELAPLARARGREVVTVYGGVSDRPQRRALARRGTIVVACPGRLEDLLGQRALRLDGVRHVVIDEADRMADMGFLPSVQRILDRTADNRQTQLFSATLGGPVASLTKRYQHNPAYHELEAVEPTIRLEDHDFRRVVRSERAHTTAAIVAEVGSSIVFCRTRHGATRLTRQLSKQGVRAAELHGGRSQGQRDRALAAFVDGRVDALVATDVAARGIHVDDIACVVHFDLPEDADTYTHRSGRTGRAGAGGRVIVLVDEQSTKAAAALRKALGHDGPKSSRTAPSGNRSTAAMPSRRNRARERSRGTGAKDPSVKDLRAKNSGGRTAKQPRPHTTAPAGHVTSLNPRRGYAFISRDKGDDLFVHRTNVLDGAWRRLSVGDAVEFRVGPGRKGDQALDVRLVLDEARDLHQAAEAVGS